MNWTPSRSIRLSKLCIKTFMVICFMLIFLLPWMGFRHYDVFKTVFRMEPEALILGYYACMVPGTVILWYLLKLIDNIQNMKLFTAENIRLLRIISWSCFGVALVTLIASYTSVFWLIISGGGAFLGILIRVIKNLFEYAKMIKEENDYTI